MSPIIHALGSWLVAAATTNNSRDRLLVTLAGVIPDADGLGIVVDVVSSVVTGHENTFHYYQQFHHYLLHGWPAALAIAGLAACFGRQRMRVLLMCLVAFHLQLLCDLLGSRGPTAGDLWPIAYGEPFFRKPVFFWRGQWRLDGWQNRLICITIFVVELGLVPRRGSSIVGIFSRKADEAFVAVLRKWRAQLMPHMRAWRPQ